MNLEEIEQELRNLLLPKSSIPYPINKFEIEKLVRKIIKALPLREQKFAKYLLSTDAVYDKKLVTYLYNNKRVSVRRLIRLSDKIGKIIFSLLQEIAKDSLDYQHNITELLFHGQFIQFLLGIGGYKNITEDELFLLYDLQQETKAYLENAFLTGFPRLHLYSNGTTGYFNTARDIMAETAGWKKEKWILNPTAQHCTDCEYLASLGWQDIGTLPIPATGDTTCLTNCRCYKRYGWRKAEVRLISNTDDYFADNNNDVWKKENQNPLYHGTDYEDAIRYLKSHNL